MRIKTITVLGANGTMGRNVSAIFASFGNAKVYMVSRKLSDAKDAKRHAIDSVKAESIATNLIPTTYESLATIIPESDLVFESVSEDLTIKSKVLDSIEGLVNENAIIGTGSSGLSINEIVENRSGLFKSQFLGIHMFNPPYNLSLCELIPSIYTSKEIVKELNTYLTNSLLRDVIVVKDQPAFLGNRIGFKFINEAMILSEQLKHKGGIDYIDHLLGNFTGRSMSPLVTADFVGLDIHKAIVDNIYEKSSDDELESFLLPEFTNKLISKGLLGLKEGKGLYFKESNDDGSKSVYVYDIETMSYRPVSAYSFSFIDNVRDHLIIGQYQKAMNELFSMDCLESKIITEIMLKYVLYSLKMSMEVAEDVHASDHAMANGFNWIPPLALVDAIGGKEEFVIIANKSLDNDYLLKMHFDKLVANIQKSKYDYRSYLKAR